MDIIINELKHCPEECKKLPNIPMIYGTAGFRTNADFLQAIVYRIGILASLRSKLLNNAVGIIVTASHNPASDNGIKFIDKTGEILDVEWEKYANEICQTEFDGLEKYINDLCVKLRINILQSSIVYVAQDTRKSGDALVESLISGIRLLPYVQAYNYGKLTTPMFQYLVMKGNKSGQILQEIEYFERMHEGFKAIKHTGVQLEKSKLMVDCANGVGAIHLREMIRVIHDLEYIQILNNESNGDVNFECGADYLYNHKKINEAFKFQENDRCVSFDGDADRIIYFYKSKEETFIIHGDYMIILIVHYITKILAEFPDEKFDIGVVYTAYTNNSVVDYLKENNIKSVCTKTGVKHLHSAAKNFDIGIYFETNGHGTVLFKDEIIEKFAKLCEDTNSKSYIPAQKIIGLSKIFNQTASDALANLLCIETILSDLKMTLEQWHNMVTFLAKNMMKIETSKKDIMAVSENEQTVIAPEKFQTEIDEIVLKYPKARAFIRPSGTENSIRIYAEATSQKACDDICEKLKDLTLKYLSE